MFKRFIARFRRQRPVPARPSLTTLFPGEKIKFAPQDG